MQALGPSRTAAVKNGRLFSGHRRLVLEGREHDGIMEKRPAECPNLTLLLPTSTVSAGTMDWARPRCLPEELGLKPGNPAPERLDRPLPLQTPSGGSPALTPYRSMTRQWIRCKKGIDNEGPVTEAFIRRMAIGGQSAPALACWPGGAKRPPIRKIAPLS